MCILIEKISGECYDVSTIYLMSQEGYDTTHEETAPDILRDNIHQEGHEIDPDVRAAFASAEEGMEEIPETIEVENVDELVQLLGINPEALEQYRRANPAE